MSYWESDKKVKFLRELVEINSGTQNIAGVNAVQDLISAYIKNLGIDVSFEYHSQGRDKSGKLLVAEISPSRGSENSSLRSSSNSSASSSQRPFIHLITHADTVFEPQSGFTRFEIQPDQGTATGPGVIDDKGGIVIALEGLERFLRKNSRNAHIRFICAPSEEIGSPGFHSFFKKLSQESWMNLGFEPSLEDGSIIESRRGNRWYRIQVSGCEAHAGRDSEKGINAAHELAFKITQLHQLTDRAQDLTVSVGQISGGSKYNIVCGHAEAKVDVRFSDFKIRDSVHNKIEEIVQQSSIGPNPSGKLPTAHYDIEDDCPPFPKTENSSHFIKTYLNIIENVEKRTVQALKSGGAADSNYFSREGLILIDGLGATGGGMHQKSEFIYLNSLETRAECLSQFLEYATNLSEKFAVR